jgi:enediyne biosynthesis protein E4
LYLNNSKGGFDDVSFASGYALNESGRETATMGIAAGDISHNGRIDLYNTTFSDDYKPFYRNDGDANFTDSSYQMGIAEQTVPFLGWGDAFIDYNNDGWLDLIQANGHVYPAVDQQNWGTSFAERPLLFHNDRGKLDLVPPVEGSGLATVGVGRGLAYGDLFNDGKIDVIINNMDGTPSFLRNVSKDENHWVELKLVGGPKSPRDAVGATIYLNANGFRQRADVISGGSFASTSDPRVHFGIGSAMSIDSVEVRWPSGAVEQIKLPGIDAIYAVIEGSGVGKAARAAPRTGRGRSSAPRVADPAS